MNPYLKFILMAVLLISGLFNVALAAVGLAYSYQAHHYQVAPVIIIGACAAVLFPSIAISFINEYWHSQRKIERMALEIDKLKSTAVIGKIDSDQHLNS